MSYPQDALPAQAIVGEKGDPGCLACWYVDLSILCRLTSSDTISVDL